MTLSIRVKSIKVTIKSDSDEQKGRQFFSGERNTGDTAEVGDGAVMTKKVVSF